MYVGWTDFYIFEMLNFIKAPKWIISWLKEVMRTWRTILQVREGKEFKLSRLAETVEFFMGIP